MGIVRTKIIICFIHLMFCEIVVAQNQTSDEGSDNDCECLTTVSTDSHEERIAQALSLPEDQDLSNRYSFNDYERIIAVFERLHLGTLFRVRINQQTRNFEIEIPTTQDIVVYGVVSAALPEALFVIGELQFRRLDVEIDDGYIADDENDDH